MAETAEKLGQACGGLGKSFCLAVVGDKPGNRNRVVMQGDGRESSCGARLMKFVRSAGSKYSGWRGHGQQQIWILTKKDSDFLAPDTI
ncbi:hypothetical protein TorRG33x02_174760 [Trema orientale]|uniref:Uncharacterized protein n=1 Tax=Trema orientale TaxID=63057 RepID=A0A2P5EMI6_TREOI|nr:hypothetical protein TorRG33x02_174760 [Trema orientale]